MPILADAVLHHDAVLYHAIYEPVRFAERVRREAIVLSVMCVSGRHFRSMAPWVAADLQHVSRAFIDTLIQHGARLTLMWTRKLTPEMPLFIDDDDDDDTPWFFKDDPAESTDSRARVSSVLSDYLPNLQELSLPHSRLHLSSVGSLRFLQKLMLFRSDHPIVAASLQHLANLPSLETLDLSGAQGCGSLEALQHVSRIPHLTDLDIRHMLSVSLEGLTAVCRARHRHMRRLNATDSKLAPHRTQSVDSVLPGLAAEFMPDLAELSLVTVESSTDFSQRDRDLHAALNACQRLEVLRLNVYGTENAAALEPLRNHPHLRDIAVSQRLYHEGVSIADAKFDAIFEILGTLTLETLDSIQTLPTERGFRALCDGVCASSLRSLWVRLSNVATVDAELGLRRLSNLTELCLFGEPSDLQLDFLEAMPLLTDFRINTTELPDEVVAAGLAHTPLLHTLSLTGIGVATMRACGRLQYVSVLAIVRVKADDADELALQLQRMPSLRLLIWSVPGHDVDIDEQSVKARICGSSKSMDAFDFSLDF